LKHELGRSLNEGTRRNRLGGDLQIEPPGDISHDNNIIIR
jgi:hypothetical protein